MGNPKQFVVFQRQHRPQGTIYEAPTNFYMNLYVMYDPEKRVFQYSNRHVVKRVY